ncbi:transcriptional regulator family: Fungal Specific TF [Penicillium maclennaniae]|uniref:transcriptional regulator family: Fungal Specific TF n=1 Tax=Penicillium maclennaniae TaxID=1343394 RepID=UPI00254218AE|nr:transcriptional regulator family: Fungal Specific TF [Penicillium maclennaniae]KAJ5670733.1 transcriptional regulator family: Fungal Specific TF [Penicillium maclennaniae]
MPRPPLASVDDLCLSAIERVSMEPASAAPRGGKLKSACDLCRVRKIRCDRVQPACENCHLAGLPCIFTPPPTQRKGLKQELADSQARVKELEAALRAAQESTSHSENVLPVPLARSFPSTPESLTTQPPANMNFVPDTHDLDAALAAFRWHLDYCGLGSALSTTRAAFSSEVQRRTGCSFDLDDFVSDLVETFHSRGLKSTRLATTAKWPPISLVQQCVKYYAKSGLYSLFPFADADALQMLLDASVLSHPQSTRAANRACGALSSPEVLMETPDLRTLEAIKMMAIYICPLGQPQSAEPLLGMAVQVLYNLGGHKVRASREFQGRPQHNQHLRALFWLCYGMDKEFSIRKGQPPLLNDADCDLELPAKYALKPSENHFYFKPLSSQELLYPSDLRFSLLKTKIFRLLYSREGQAHSEARRLQLIRELDDELSALKMEYPVECRPDAFATQSAPDYLFHDLSIRGVSIHLEYYYCLGKIHGASDLYNIPTMQNWSPLPSSAEICYEAARSTLIYMTRVQHYVNYHTFWIHAQFVLTATITLFRFLIMMPHASTFARDIRILEDVAAIFAQYSTGGKDGKCFPPFYLTYYFIQKLIFLAKRSLSKSMER